MGREAILPIPKPGRSPGLCFVRGRGFTLTELIVVIVVAGILAAVALPRFTGETGFEARGLRDETAAALRYAQKSAIAARRLVCLNFTASGLAATIATPPGAADCTVGTVLAGPSGTALAVTATGGAMYSAQPSATLIFNPLGRPSLATTISVQGLPAALNIVVEAETGYVH